MTLATPNPVQAALLAHRAGNLDQAERHYAATLQHDSNQPEALNGLGAIAMQRGRSADGIALFRAAWEVGGPARADYRENLVKALLVHAIQLATAAQVEDAVAALEDAAEVAGEESELRRSVGVQAMIVGGRLADRIAGLRLTRLANRLLPETPEIRNQLFHVLSDSGEPARLSDFAPELREEDLAVRPVIACFPKSGSTLLKTLVMRASGLPDQFLSAAFQQNEQEMHLPYVRESATRSAVAQIHCRATEPNLHVMRAFGLRPVVLVRNLHDTLLSFKEFYDAGAHINTFCPHYPELDDAARLDFVVDERAYWYLSFYASWQRAIAGGRIEGMWLTYEALVADKAAALARVLEFHGIPRSRPEIAAAVAEAEGPGAMTRLNKGVAGRGRAALGDERVARIAAMARYFPDVDFSAIGVV